MILVATAVQTRNVQRGQLAVVTSHGRHLLGQFTSRQQHQHDWTVARTSIRLTTCVHNGGQQELQPNGRGLS